MSLSTALVAASSALVLTRRGLARTECRHVTREGGKVPPSDTGKRRHGPDPDTEVVVAAPDPQVVPRAELAVALAAEVRRLVPAVAGPGQRRHDLLEVALHRLRLASELLSVCVREPRSRLRLELVARQVLGLERQGVREVRIEVGGALAGDPVDEIERNVVETGITESLHCPPDVVRDRQRARALRAGAAENDCAPSETRFTPCSRSSAASAGVTVSGVGLDRQLLDLRERAEHARERRGAR